MKATAVLVNLFALVVIGIDSVSAGCHGSGDTWQDAGAARSHVKRVYKGYYGNARRFQGTFTPRESRHVYVQHSGTQKFDFIIRNENNGIALDLGDADYVLRLQNEINACPRGDQSSALTVRGRVTRNSIRAYLTTGISSVAPS
ncbi:uncharacterized protein NECHADRAFT_106590 [Fusarium vanettenii 77-13-4]|uniref:Uncharacterized protein n=1 Tax=Fusarium vanettenii (strain ATCC MYA-4622 / CBS 123669 / FGSC 9596 / NRRL 45880 / 77-13-4) TaxID=660122 RepID=C7ZKA2_FUSV7|nr:uncharacterized protein NECHADRAFT_106590 [Fusarium vanettenii 77-13-4]EEU35523.1 predicted protein [Fusarium vanettenii 77-13-4]